MVLFRRGRPLSRFIANPVGDGLLARARTLSFALLGTMTAVGLGLVVFISQLGWPYILGGPIPGLPHSAVHSRVIASRPTTSNQVPVPGSGSKPVVAPKPLGTGTGLAASGLSGNSKAVAPSPSPSHGNDQTPANGAPSGPPGNQPSAAAPAPAPSPPPAASSPPSTVASVAGSPKGNGKGEVHSKAVSSSVAKARSYHQASHVPAVPAEPSSPVATGPGKDQPSPPSGETGKGHGNGHAYGHYGK